MNNELLHMNNDVQNLSAGVVGRSRGRGGDNMRSDNKKTEKMELAKSRQTLLFLHFVNNIKLPKVQAEYIFKNQYEMAKYSVFVRKRALSQCTESRNNRVSPLSHYCLDTIAKNLTSYQVQSLEQLSSYLRVGESAYLSVKATEFRTLNDENICILADVDSKSLMLNEFVSSSGIKRLLEVCEKKKNQIQGAMANDSWETLDTSTVEMRLPFSYLEDIYLMETQLDMNYLSLIGNTFPNLRNICLYHTNSNGSESYLQLLNSFLSNYLTLSYLELSYCSWIDMRVLRCWGVAISNARLEKGPLAVLPSLRCVKVIGYNTMLNEPQTAVVQHFNETCGITLIIS